MWQRYVLGLLADALGRAGRVTAGLDALADALDSAHRSGARWFEAELNRLRGELLLALPAPDRPKAEACFRRAMDIARAQSAKLWELRAATSLARLWSNQGRRTEVHELLAPIHGWFTEGFGSPDLQDAAALLHPAPESASPSTRAVENDA
jgi:predicted ATPase